jgi:hypothetical protein
MMFSPFQACWDRVARAEFHRQALINVWQNLDIQDVYSSSTQIDSDGNGKVFFRSVKRDWLLPFSLQMGEMIYQLRAGLESCVYDAAALEFGQNPPPDEKSWTFPFCETADKFEITIKRMKNLPSGLRGLLESIQPYKGLTCSAEGLKWDIGQALNILNVWSVIDRHRRLNLVGTAISKGEVGFRLPPGMVVESWDCEVGKHLLEDDTEIAHFRVRNYIPGTQANVQTNFGIEILVDEVPGKCRIQVAATTMGMSVSAVREMFEAHYGIKR